MADTGNRHRDIEESEEQLDQEPDAPVQFWEAKQRELVTSMVDYNLATLTDLITTKAIDLNPRYQRRFRWDGARQSKLIESFLMNVPVPPIFLNEDKYGKYSVIDGKQRLMAIWSFMRGRLELTGLEIFGDCNGQSFDDLHPDLQSVIKLRPTLRAIIILRQSDPDVKLEVFQRLNTGGVKLNAQEIRNSAYPGPLNDKILDLSELPAFHKLLGIKRKEESVIYQEMRDAELVLRYFTFMDSWETFSSRVRSCLDHFLLDNQRMAKKKIEQLEAEFLNAIEAVEAAFGEYAFRRYLPGKDQWRRQVLAALYDAQMLACHGLDPDDLRPRRSKIITRMKRLFNDASFQSAISAGTNTPTLFQYRVRMMKELITTVISE
ncbi:DUF262 domain-containing protein [Gemmata sp.]|uniref:DUF262 domain-containing protein n=1 Tax=Gemmata sp. TaxID=1914242 RepID=UPI003F730C09